MKNKKAFTLIELIMVIIILGIVSSMGASIIAQVYQNFLRTNAINKLETQTTVVLEQIAKRLSHRVRRSASIIRGGNFVPLIQAQPTDTTLIWIGQSYESSLQGWNGFIDLDSAQTNGAVSPKTIQTPGSDLTGFTRNIIFRLTDGDIDLNAAGGNRPALIFKTPFSEDNEIARYYSNTNNDYTIKTQATGADVFSIVGDDTSNYTGGVKKIYEQYYLAHSAYALVPVGDPDDFNLTLRYNFQPWEGESWDGANTPTTVLAEHVSTFRFMQRGNVIRLKLCIHDDRQSADDDFSACKETAVF